MKLSNQLQIDSLHCRAICDEIGERLRCILRPEAVNLPPRFQILIDRLADQDRELTPSIVPDLDDLVSSDVRSVRSSALPAQQRKARRRVNGWPIVIQMRQGNGNAGTLSRSNVNGV
jgi:hypothetical protein